ncbi:MAG TPA: zf-HC2 domain-containing protein [Fimbriimonadales bacterium]|nr:zf-HC2 domain-containing protein [Fimbriimonadales bacterium]
MANQKDIWDELEKAFDDHGSLDEEMFELLSAYLDGACSHKERRLVEAYLEEVPGAEKVLAELRSQSSLVRVSEEPPSWLRESIFSKTTQRRNIPVLALRASPAAAVIVSVVVLGFWYSSGNISSNSEERLVSKPKVAMNKPNAALVESSPLASAKPAVKNEKSQSRTTPKVVHNTPRNSLAVASKPNSTPIQQPRRNDPALAYKTPTGSGGESGSSGLIQRQRPLPDAPDVIGMINESAYDDFSHDRSSVSGDSDAKEQSDAKTIVTKNALAKLRERLREINTKELGLPSQLKDNATGKTDKTQSEKTKEGA